MKGPTGMLDRRPDRAGQGVGAGEQRGAADAEDGDDEGVARGAAGHPPRMGNDQAEEAEQAGDRRRSCRQQRCRDPGAEPDQLRARAERGGDVVAEGQPVERSERVAATRKPARK